MAIKLGFGLWSYLSKRGAENMSKSEFLQYVVNSRQLWGSLYLNAEKKILKSLGSFSENPDLYLMIKLG